MTQLAVVLAGDNPTRLWGLTMRTRLERIARAQGFLLGGDGAALVASAHFAFDPAWLGLMAARPGMVLTREGAPVIAHVAGDAAAAADAIAAGRVPPSLTPLPYEAADDINNDELRKKERPFVERLAPGSVRAIERASYFGAYKGVTDVLTKYLWPEWALVLTRIAARLGITPNMVTTLGAILCALAAVAFYRSDYWLGLALGLGFMVLDTVDGKLARCTITSSWWGNVFDHGIDLVHPPFWWYAWGVGLAGYGVPLADATFWACIAVIVGGYVVQRLIEGAFILWFGIHIHVWRPFDSWFRLITARRNPNMVILLAFLLVGRPDWGLVAVAVWTVLSLLVHAVQLAQALAARARGRTVRSWLA